METLVENLNEILCGYENEFDELTAVLFTSEGLYHSYCREKHPDESEMELLSAALNELYTRSNSVTSELIDKTVKSIQIIPKDGKYSYIIRPVNESVFLGVKVPYSDLNLAESRSGNYVDKLKIII